MNAGLDIATVAALVADPSRARILLALMDDLPKTAKELAFAAQVTPQTASSHLAKLVEARLLAVQAQGRHRYFRLAGEDVGRAVGALMAVARPGRVRDPGPAEAAGALRTARTCYDHLAGRLGVVLTDAMVKRKWLEPQGRDYRVTRRGDASLRALGVAVDRARGQRRTFARQCLDWSERRVHLAGALGAAFAARCFELGWLESAPEGRQVALTGRGRRGLDRALAVGRRLDQLAPLA